MGELLFREEERVQDRGGGNRGQHLNWIPESGITSNGTERQLMRAEKQFMRNMNKAYLIHMYKVIIPFISRSYYSFLPFGALGRKLGKAR